MQFANSSFPCYSTFTSDSCHTVNHLVAITFVDEETLVMLVGYPAAACAAELQTKVKRIFHNHEEGPYTPRASSPF